MRIKTLIALILTTMFLSSCSIGSPIRASERRNNYVEDHPVDTADHPDHMREVHKNILAGNFWIGASTDQVFASLGTPADINRTATSTTKREQWVYGFQAGSRLYIYFRDGVVTSWSK